MTLRANAPHAKRRWSALIIVVTMTLGLTATAVLAAPAGISLEQCRNGAADSPSDCTKPGATNATGWVNGNVGASQGHLLEGYSIPYRAIMTNLPTDGTLITVTLGYDIKHSGANAIDYLTQYERLESHAFFEHPAEDVDPTSGTSLDINTFSTEAIDAPTLPAAPLAGFNGLAADKKVMTLFGGTFVANSFTYVNEGSLTASQSETQISVQFTATSSTAVLAWGGHIARGDQWDGQSASAISGSPYHMRVKAWTLSNVGNQDRSLSAGAVQSGPSTTTTTPSGTATFVATLDDSATVGGDSPTGNVTFKLYGLGDTTCTGTAIFEKTVALDATGTASTTGTAVGTPIGSANDGGRAKVTVAGTYRWSVFYAGDGGNEPSESICVESTTVTGPTFVNVPDPVPAP